MFTSILNETTGTLSITNALICTLVSVALGAVIAVVYKLQGGKTTKNLTISLVILPAIVQLVIMMVNGNLGVGVAVLGAFSLVRFRSVPGSSREICFIFFAMAVGLATGMGHLTFAAATTVVIGIVLFVLSRLPIGKAEAAEKLLRINIPEDLDYTGCFDDVFGKYTKKCELEKVRTTNLGTMYELSYKIMLTDITKEKAMIDEIRCRNGNLPIICGKVPVTNEEI